MAGVIGATIHLSGQTALQSIQGFNSTCWPDGSYAAQGMKVYFNGPGPAGMSDGTGNSTSNKGSYPTTDPGGIATGQSANFTTLVFNYRPYINQTLTSWDSTAGTSGSGTTATHGGTPADYAALVASIQALNSLCLAAGIKMYVVLWQEIEHMGAPTTGGGINLTAVQYWSMLSWYRNAITDAGLTADRLLHSSSATYAGRLDSFFPANQQNATPPGPQAPLVGGGTTDFYSRSYQNNVYRLDSVPANANYSTCIIDHCKNAGIPFMGLLEFGVGGNNVPDVNGIYAYLTHINEVAKQYPDAFYWWYGEYQDSPFGLIPGYASGQTISNPPPSPAQNPGPNCPDPMADSRAAPPSGTTYLGITALAGTIYGDPEVNDTTGSRDNVTIRVSSVHADPVGTKDNVSVHTSTPVTEHVGLTDSVKVFKPVTVIGPPGTFSFIAPAGSVIVGSGSSREYLGIMQPVVMPIEYSTASFLTPVSSTASVAWRTVASGVSSKSVTWNTLKATTARATADWDVYEPVAVSAALAWRTLGQVTQETQAAWRVLQRVSEDAIYNGPVLTGPVMRPIQSTGSWGNAVLVGWQTAGRISSSAQVGWNVLAVGAPSLAKAAWNILAGHALPVRSLAWQDLGLVTSDASTGWVTLKRVTSSASVGWETVGRVTSKVQANWDTMATRYSYSPALTQWNVQVNPAPVLKNTKIHWKTLKQVSSSVSVGWRNYGRTSSVATSKWDVSARSASSVQIGWGTVGRKSATAKVKWNTTVTHTSSRRVHWNVTVPGPVCSTQLGWKVRELVTVPALVAWNTKDRQKTSTALIEWNTAKVPTYPVTSSCTLRWGVYRQKTILAELGWMTGFDNVTSSVSVGWNTLMPILSEQFLQWQTQAGLSVPATILWNTLMAVIMSPPMMGAEKAILGGTEESGPRIQWNVGQPVQLGARQIAQSAWSKME